MNADNHLINAIRENDALREALRLLGFDPEKVIDAVNSPVDRFWYRETLGITTSSINPEDPRIARRGFSDKAVAAMQSVFSSLRIQPSSSDSASVRPATDLAV